MSTTINHCPSCGSTKIRFREKRNDWFCDGCDHQWTLDEPIASSSAEASRAAPPPQVFISYSRADALEFAQRLATDLEYRGDHRVFLDLQSIEKGELFEVRIERGIRESSVCAAVMTHRSMADDSVCRDEIVYALNEGKKVVPLRVEPDPALKPTLLLARRNWIDFTEDYQAGLESLLHLLAGDESGLREPALPIITGVVPLDFSVEIARFYTGFTGRQWIVEEIDSWLRKQEQRALVIVAEPGVGKSAIAAWLCQTRSDVVGIHFCTQQNTRSRDPYEFVACLVGQLQARLPGFAKAVQPKRPEARRDTAGDAFRELIVEPSRSLAEPSEQRLIIVDSLDEAATQTGETVADVLVGQARDLPPWLRIVTTTRPEEPILRRIRNLKVFELQTDRHENRSDVREFIDARLCAGTLSATVGAEPNQVAERIESLSEGNFLYARLALDALEDGSLGVGDLGQLSNGLEQFYADAFCRRFRDIDSFNQQYAPLLRVLAAARAPLPFPLLLRACSEPAETVHQRLLEFRSYLKIFGSGTSAEFALFHKSLQDWLINADAAGPYWCQASTGHTRLAEICWAEYESGVDRISRYTLAHLPEYLIAAERWDELEQTLTDLCFLESKNEAGMTYDLAGDFRHAVDAFPPEHPQRPILQLLEDALRRDIHFIARHSEDYPQALFQSLWNTSVRGRQFTGLLRSERPGPKLYKLLETWRAEKESRSRGFVWIRSLRPAPIHSVQTVQNAVFFGHEDQVESASYSPDGQWIVSGSKDTTVRVWDTASSAELACLRGHEASVKSVSYSPDGQRIVSGSRDTTVRVWDSASGAKLGVLRGHESDVWSVAISPDGLSIVSGSSDKTVRVWDVESGAELGVLRGHESDVWSVAISPDGLSIVSGSKDTTVRVWDVKSGAELGCRRGHRGWVASVAFSPDGRRIASGSWDSTVRIWDVESGSELAVLRSHEGAVTSVSWSPDGRRIVSGSSDKTVRVWDAETAAELNVIRALSGVTHVSYSPDGRRILSGLLDETVWVWNSEIDTRWGLFGMEKHVLTVSYSSDGRRILSESLDGNWHEWDAETGDCLDGIFQVLRRYTSPAGRAAKLISTSTRRLLRGADALFRVVAKIFRRQSFGCAEVTAITPTPKQYSLRAVSDGQETSIESALDGTAIAWFPVSLFQRSGELLIIATHPSGRAWAGAYAHHVYILKLEGDVGDNILLHQERPHDSEANDGGNYAELQPDCDGCRQPSRTETNNRT